MAGGKRGVTKGTVNNPLGTNQYAAGKGQGEKTSGLYLRISEEDKQLLKEAARKQGMIDQVLTDDLVEGDKKLKAEIQDLIKELIARKNRYFSEHKRMIIDFELKDEGSGYHLSVASTLLPKSSDSDEE